MRDDAAPARFLWLPPGLRPPVAMVWRQERVFLLVGAAALFAGYDLNVYGLAIPQIQASFQIPENQVALIVAYFRMAAFVAMLICASADLVGRRRLLLITILGQAIATLATSFAGNSSQFLWAQFCTRAFGYAEEMLCFVVIAEEVAAASRGWASGALSAMNYTGAGIASLVFAAVNFLPLTDPNNFQAEPEGHLAGSRPAAAEPEQLHPFRFGYRLRDLLHVVEVKAPTWAVVSAPIWVVLS